MQVVDYPGISADKRLQDVLTSLATMPKQALTKNETYALFMNGTRARASSHRLARALGS